MAAAGLCRCLPACSQCCIVLGKHCWLAAAGCGWPCRLLLVVCRVNSNCGVYHIAPSVQVGRPPRMLHDQLPVGAPCCPPGGGGGGGSGPSVDGGRGSVVVGCGGGQRHTPSVYHEPCWLPPCAHLADRLWRLGSPQCWVDGTCCVAVAFAVPRHASLAEVGVIARPIVLYGATICDTCK
jgi:hypothetical protein